MAERIQRKRTKRPLADRRATWPSKTKEARRQWLASSERPRAKCHPEKPHRAHGLCDTCYDRWLYANSETHKEQRKRSAKDWQSRYPGRRVLSDKRGRLMRRYGLTDVQVEEMFAAQQGKCAICGQSGLRLAIDHCHSTGKVRGLLCLPCNGSLGWVERLLRKEEADWIAAASKYLERSGAS